VGGADGRGRSVTVFHRDRWASAVRWNGDREVAVTVRAEGGDRWRARGLTGLDRWAPKPVERPWVATAGEVEIPEGRGVVRRARRSPNPIRREATLDHQCPSVPRRDNLPITLIST
jgi:hypothetical protein